MNKVDPVNYPGERSIGSKVRERVAADALRREPVHDADVARLERVRERGGGGQDAQDATDVRSVAFGHALRRFRSRSPRARAASRASASSVHSTSRTPRRANAPARRAAASRRHPASLVSEHVPGSSSSLRSSNAAEPGAVRYMTTTPHRSSTPGTVKPSRPLRRTLRRTSTPSTTHECEGWSCPGASTRGGSVASERSVRWTKAA